MKQVLDLEQREAVQTLRNADINSEEGLPEELFLLVSSLVPLPNVDLLIVGDDNRILLTRRRDSFFENSWHIPGGTMRYGESFEHAIKSTALRELKSSVSFDDEPIAVKNVIRGLNNRQEYPRERGHNVAILYRCFLPQDYVIDNGELTEKDNGYIKWFDFLPDDFMSIQNVYKDILKQWVKK